jgi:hypothetical protein
VVEVLHRLPQACHNGLQGGGGRGKQRPNVQHHNHVWQALFVAVATDSMLWCPLHPTARRCHKQSGLRLRNWSNLFPIAGDFAEVPSGATCIKHEARTCRCLATPTPDKYFASASASACFTTCNNTQPCPPKFGCHNGSCCVRCMESAVHALITVLSCPAPCASTSHSLLANGPYDMVGSNTGEAKSTIRFMRCTAQPVQDGVVHRSP